MAIIDDYNKKQEYEVISLNSFLILINTWIALLQTE